MTRNGIAESYNNFVFHLLKNCQTIFCKASTILYSYEKYGDSDSSTSSPTLVIVWPFDFSHPRGYEVFSLGYPVFYTLHLPHLGFLSSYSDRRQFILGLVCHKYFYLIGGGWSGGFLKHNLVFFFLKRL
jgi:hypothetical protein